MESMAAADGLRLAELPLERQDAYWERAKQAEKAAQAAGD
jgi:nucleoside triphosphate diphosphatase